MVDVAPRTREQYAEETTVVDAEVDAQLAETSAEASVDVESLQNQLMGTWADVSDRDGGRVDLALEGDPVAGRRVRAEPLAPARVWV